MNALVFGASAGLGRTLCEVFAKHGYNLLMIAGDRRDLVASASHLSLLYSIKADIVDCRIGQDGEWLRQVREKITAFGPINVVLLPIGMALPDDDVQLDERSARAIMEVNFFGITQVVDSVLDFMLNHNRGTIVGFGSVAALRGRSRNVYYGAAKRALLSYFESLQHEAACTAVRVQFYQVGYLDTQQNFAKRLPFPRLSPAAAAEHVYRKLDSNLRMAFLPGFWGIIDLILRCLPWAIFKRLRF